MRWTDEAAVAGEGRSGERRRTAAHGSPVAVAVRPPLLEHVNIPQK